VRVVVAVPVAGEVAFLVRQPFEQAVGVVEADGGPAVKV
jgi:hypothetical protein